MDFKMIPPPEIHGAGPKGDRHLRGAKNESPGMGVNPTI